jgi:hypothetical protein
VIGRKPHMSGQRAIRYSGPQSLMRPSTRFSFSNARKASLLDFSTGRP